MPPTLLKPPSASIARHLLSGCSTGYMRDHRHNWPALAEAAASVSAAAVELSALHESELSSLIEYLDSEGSSLSFAYVAVHAPTKGRELSEAELADQLASLPVLVRSVVLHPDVIEDAAAYECLGQRAVIENMDRRKGEGRSAEELAPFLESLPEAGLCLDLAHAKDVDPSMGLANEIMDQYSRRLRQIHISSLDSGGRHASLTPEDEILFEPVLRRCRGVPWILEAPPSSH